MRGLTRIGAVIYCEKKSHKGMIIGKEGRKLKGVGKSARADIEALLGTRVFLQLWVKVRENWRDSDFALRSLGYEDE
ncbi:MAG: KH domain-containing protein, partial [Clostridiales Family XIII bacterium]|jgi:GTP-binding protein Era|nr:KH domain-containing protein [Clostridiales Family XIII bacterium]